jgi:hypothetical protein
MYYMTLGPALKVLLHIVSSKISKLYHFRPTFKKVYEVPNTDHVTVKTAARNSRRQQFALCIQYPKLH